MATELAFTKGGWLHPDQMPQIRSLGAWDATQKGNAFKNPSLVENRPFVFAPFSELLPVFFEPRSEGDLIPAIPSSRE